MTIKMKTKHEDNYLLYKALGVVHGGTSGSQRLFEELLKEGEIDIPTKNVCAQLDMTLVNDLEYALGMTRMTKREFITMSLRSSLSRLEEIFEEYGVDGYLEEMEANIDDQEASE